MSAATSPTNIPARKSFAQVAAAAHKPAPPQIKAPTVAVADTSAKEATTIDSSEQSITKPSEDSSERLPERPSQDALASAAAATAPSQDVSRLNSMMKSANLEEPSTQSSERNSRIDYSDTKSVASRTTFTLDEKESLRPDDSASMQAGADDDSPSESVLAGAKAPSNPDMRAFRDQLYEIDRTENSGMLMQRGPAQVCLLRSSASAGDVVDNKAQQPPPSTGPPPGLVIPPDEKLQEALASPKDRLFVLKVEQDLIDFITDSKESELQLPQTNAFYRMLCHKLAEYYFLGHVVDEQLSAVRIFRLPHSRLPPSGPLIDSESKPEASTPPPPNSTRKIMRRGDSDQGLFSKDSEGDRPDTGNVSGSEADKDNENKPRDKSSLTREEREKQYAEVRARIFEDFSEGKTDGDGTSGGQDSKGLSRASSASGNRKKKKRPKDDSFEARSAYSQFNGQSYVNQGYYATQANAPYYPVMPGYQGQGFPGQAQQYPPGSSQGYGQHGQQDFSGGNQQGQWHQPQFGGQYEMGGQYGSSQYDPSSGYQSYPNMHSQSTPRAQQPSLAGYYQGYQQSPNGMMLPQQPFSNGFNQAQMYPGSENTGGQYPNMFGHAQGGYGQLDFHPQQGFNPYQAAPFNPQSQSFIPRVMPGPGQWAPMPGQMPMQQRPTSAYASPRFSSSSSPNTGSVRGQSSQHQPPQHPPQQGKRGAGAQQPGTPGGGGGHVESITKWATPANLPPKPPPQSNSINFALPKGPPGGPFASHHALPLAGGAGGPPGAGPANDKAGAGGKQ